MTSQVGAPTKRQYRLLIDAFRRDRGDVKGAADAAEVSPVTAQQVYEGKFAKSYPWCVSIRDFLDGKVEIDLDVYNGKRRPREANKSAPLAAVAVELPDDAREILERLSEPVEDKVGRERDHRTLLAINRRITGIRLGSVAESTLRLPKLLNLLHARAEEFLTNKNLSAEALVMGSQAALNIVRIHQAMTAQVTDIVKAEREMNPRDEVAQAERELTPEEAKVEAMKMLKEWGPALVSGHKPAVA